MKSGATTKENIINKCENMIKRANNLIKEVELLKLNKPNAQNTNEVIRDLNRLKTIVYNTLEVVRPYQNVFTEKQLTESDNALETLNIRMDDFEKNINQLKAPPQPMLHYKTHRYAPKVDKISEWNTQNQNLLKPVSHAGTLNSAELNPIMKKIEEIFEAYEKTVQTTEYVDIKKHSTEFDRMAKELIQILKKSKITEHEKKNMINAINSSLSLVKSLNNELFNAYMEFCKFKEKHIKKHPERKDLNFDQYLQELVEEWHKVHESAPTNRKSSTAGLASMPILVVGVVALVPLAPIVAGVLAVGLITLPILLVTCAAVAFAINRSAKNKEKHYQTCFKLLSDCPNVSTSIGVSNTALQPNIDLVQASIKNKISNISNILREKVKSGIAENGKLPRRKRKS